MWKKEFDANIKLGCNFVLIFFESSHFVKLWLFFLQARPTKGQPNLVKNFLIQ